MTLQERRETRPSVEDDWTLNADQMLFMLQHHNPIEAAYASDDLDFLRELAKSKAYMAAFGAMPWDEAYDRYECISDIKAQIAVVL
jgi:hypothetical protein